MKHRLQNVMMHALALPLPALICFATDAIYETNEGWTTFWCIAGFWLALGFVMGGEPKTTGSNEPDVGK